MNWISSESIHSRVEKLGRQLFGEWFWDVPDVFSFLSLLLGALPAATDGCSWMQGSSIHRQTGGTRWRPKPVYSIFPTKPAQVSSVQDLFDFICSGPLFDKLGLNPERVTESLDKWLAYGLQLSRLFQLNELYLTVPQKARFYHYYIPVFLWCEDQIAQHYSKFKEGEDIPPLVVGAILLYYPNIPRGKKSKDGGHLRILLVL